MGIQEHINEYHFNIDVKEMEVVAAGKSILGKE